MPCWYYDKKDLKNTPSSLDNIDYETELRYRKEGARFIINTGLTMGIGYNTSATGVVYFHRFYMFHSFKKFPRFVTACCCLFLAGKVEETPKKCKDIIKTARTLLNDAKFSTFGEDPKEEVMTLERILLQTIKFDLQVEHPYSYLVKYAKCLKGAEDEVEEDEKKRKDKEEVKLQKMVQMAWTFVNDSLCTTLSLQWEPEIIAVALLYLATRLSQFKVIDWAGRQSKHLRWWDMYVEGLSLDLLENICHQVLDLYSQPSTNIPDSPPLSVKSSNQPATVKSVNGQDKDVNSMEVIEVIPPPAISAPIPEIPPSYPPYSATFPPAPQHPPVYPPPPFSNPAVAAVVPPPHIVAPPPGPPPTHLGPSSVPYPSYVAPPPHYPPVMPSASYYQPSPSVQSLHNYQPTPPIPSLHGYQPVPPGQPPHRPFYPPPL